MVLRQPKKTLQMEMHSGREAQIGLYAAEVKRAAENAEKSAERAKAAEAGAIAAVESERYLPIPGNNGNWQVWDREHKVYVDSGESCRGERGPAGAAGLTGPKGDPGEVTAEQLNNALSLYRTAAAQDEIEQVQDDRIEAAAQATETKTLGPSAAIGFNASAADMPLKGLVVDIKPVQTGEGDASPINIVPITGRTGCSIVQSPTLDAQDGTTFSISWADAVGTVYSGTLDAVNKKLTVTHVISENGEDGRFYTNGMSGALQYNTLSGYAFYSILNAGVQHASGICSMGEYRNIFSGGDGWYFTSSATYDRIDFRLSEIPQWGTGSTAAENVAIIKNYLAEQYALGKKLQFLVKLQNPVVYDLTGIPEITTMLGTNNIWADCGDVTVTYGAYLETVKAHAEKLGDGILSAIAPLEQSYTASKNYIIGSYLFVGTKLYKVTAAIAEGGTITPDTNVTQTTVAEQLMALAAQ